MRFAVIDLETANARRDSICQIGIVVFDGGREIASDVALINPDQEFDPFNVSLHGIDQHHVRESLRFVQVREQLERSLRGQYVVSHSNFDRAALDHSCDLHGVERFACNWVDSIPLARRAWPHLAESGGYGLANLASEFGIAFRHHDALEDARAAGHVVVRALAELGMELNDWQCQPVAAQNTNRNSERNALHRLGDGDGPLLGESLVFTGNFTARKSELADMAHIAGTAVEPGVNKAPPCSSSARRIGLSSGRPGRARNSVEQRN